MAQLPLGVCWSENFQVHLVLIEFPSALTEKNCLRSRSDRPHYYARTRMHWPNQPAADDVTTCYYSQLSVILGSRSTVHTRVAHTFLTFTFHPW